MFSSLLNIKRSFSLRPTDFNPNTFWIVTVQDWSKTSPANAYRPLGTLNFVNLIDIENLLVKNSIINSSFLIINE